MLIIAIAYRTISTLAGWGAIITSLCPIAHADAFAIGSLMALTEKSEGVRDERKERTSIITGAGVGVSLLLISIGVTAAIKGVSYGTGYQLYKSSSNYLNNPMTCNIYLYLALFSAALFKCAKGLSLPSKGVIIKSLIGIGNLSYTGYLVHWPICVVLKRVTNHWAVVFAVTLIATIVGSVIIERLIKMCRIKRWNIIT